MKLKKQREMPDSMAEGVGFEPQPFSVSPYLAVFSIFFESEKW